jgi:hypothetical protein
MLVTMTTSPVLAQFTEEEGPYILPESPCGTTGKTAWLQWYQAHKEAITNGRDVDTTWLYIPVTIHNVTGDNGENYYPINQIMRIICDMNEQFMPARIKYYLHPTEPVIYHANSEWFDHDWDGGADMIQSTRIDDRLNCYIVGNPAGNCGYSWYDAIVMSRGCSGVGNSTWAHEAGHHFSLPHTFFGWEGQNWDYNQAAPLDLGWNETELTDGSNCQNASDGFCDTPPDYLNYRWQCDTNERSFVTQIDPDGVSFKSDATLFMSYSYDACASRFSAEQIEAMRTNINTEHSAYLQTTEWGPLVPDDQQVQLVSPVDSAIVQYNNFTLTWLPVPNATFYHIQVSIFGTFQPVIFSTSVQDVTSVNVQRNNMPKNYTLFWRVTPYNNWDPCFSGYSQMGVFKTRNLSSVSAISDVATVGIAPNPATQGTPTQLTLISTGTTDLQLEVFDATGRLIHRIQDRVYDGSEQVYELNNGAMLSGTYMVRIQTERGTLVKQFVVVD